MKLLYGQRGWVLGGFLGYVLLALGFSAAYSASSPRTTASVNGNGIAAFSGPTYSSPIAMSADQSRIWVVNPDDDSVSVISNLDTTPSVVKFPVGDEPQSVALDAAGVAYVANAASNSVTIVNASTGPLGGALTTGAEPWNIVASPDGLRVFVANSGQDTITIIRTDTRQIVGSVNLQGSACNVGDLNRHFQPRGLAVTADSTKLYVTRFLSFTKTGGQQATDNGKEGVVCRFTVNTAGTTAATVLTAPTPITLAAQETGFTAKVGNPPADTPTSAYPNQMQSVVICGSGANARAYLPNIAASPSGPLRFDVDTHAFVNMIGGVNGGTQTDLGALNLHLGALGNNPRLFFANVWAFACVDPNHTTGTTAYAVSAGSDVLVKVNVAADGALSFTDNVTKTKFIDLNPGASTGDVTRNNGKNPLGLVIRNNQAFVMNYISRNVSVVDLTTDSVVDTIETTALPTPGSEEEQLQVGAEIFFSSRGKFDRPGGTTVPTANRLSANGWQNCASCHFAGLTDGNVWTFGAGPRKSVPLNGTWNPHNPDDQRVLNYSAIFDEVQDFEANIRNVSGPGNDPVTGGFRATHGLLISDTGDINTPPAVINAFLKANAGRPQLSVTLPGSSTGWPALDAMTEWIRFAVRTPNGALTDAEISQANGGLSQSAVNNGRNLFFQAGCQTCHGGGKWTNSQKDFVSPPAGTEVFCEVDLRLATPPVANPPPGCRTAPPAGVTPIGTQFLARFLQNIDSFNLGVPGANKPINGTEVGGFERANANNVTGNAGPLAIGTDHNQDGQGNGYNVPSLLGINVLPPYYHNGSCETLACVISNVAHRTKGLRQGQNDPFTNATNRANIIAFLETLDADTTINTNLYINKHDIFFDPAAPIATQVFTPGVNLSIFGPGVTFSTPIKVQFKLFRGDQDTPIDTKETTLAAFTHDFGQERVESPPFTLPSRTGSYVMEVTVDSDNTFAEDKENDNTARRRFNVRPVPPDRTPPEISSVAINNDDLFTDNRDVTISFDAVDPPGPNGQQPTGVTQYCVVTYYYDGRQRRWVERNCDFEPLGAGSGNTFTVDAEIPNRIGVAYVFVWVKDAAGNISTTPGFDFINFFPSGEQRIERNDTRVFRFRLDAATPSATVEVIPVTGDVDLSTFQGFTDPVRCAVSANIGLVADSTTVPSGNCTGTDFQIEVRAIVNSRFNFSFSQASNAARQASPSAIVPTRDLLDDTPLVSGPPARQSAIDGGATIFLPLTVK